MRRGGSPQGWGVDLLKQVHPHKQVYPLKQVYPHDLVINAP